MGKTKERILHQSVHYKHRVPILKLFLKSSVGMPPHGMEVDLTVQKMVFGFDSVTSSCDSFIEFL